MQIQLRNICVPVDFSETSAAALNYAKALADAFGVYADPGVGAFMKEVALRRPR